MPWIEACTLEAVAEKALACLAERKGMDVEKGTQGVTEDFVLGDDDG